MKPSPIRVIIYFANATTSNPALDRAVSDACRCQAVFLRQYRDNVLIYEVALQQDQTFASFKQTLLAKKDSLGIQAMEQDAMMRHQ